MGVSYNGYYDCFASNICKFDSYYLHHTRALASGLSRLPFKEKIAGSNPAVRTMGS